METKTVRASGIQTPAYLNGRSRGMLMDAFRPSAPASVESPSNFITTLRSSGMRAGEGVPFAAIYMARSKKKLALLPTAA